MIRIGSYRIHQSLVQKPLKINDFWELWSDRKKESYDTMIMTKEMMEQIKKAHGIN